MVWTEIDKKLWQNVYFWVNDPFKTISEFAGSSFPKTEQVQGQLLCVEEKDVQ